MTIVAEKLIETIQQLTELEREHIVASILKTTPNESTPKGPETPYNRSCVISNSALLGGEPVIRGTRTPVRAIVEMWQMGVVPEEIPEHLPHISLARVFDALSYYIDHQAEVNHYIEINRIPKQLIHPAVQRAKGMA